MRKSTENSNRHNRWRSNRFLLCNISFLKNTTFVLILLLIYAICGSQAQLIKALGNLLMPALDFIKPNIPKFGQTQLNSPNNQNNFNTNNGQHQFGSRNTICRNTVEGHTVCGFGSGKNPQHRYDEGTLEPHATGFDEILPSNCGRKPFSGEGKLCFPDGLLCQRSKSLQYMISYITFLLHNLCKIPKNFVL